MCCSDPLICCGEGSDLEEPFFLKPWTYWRRPPLLKEIRLAETHAHHGASSTRSCLPLLSMFWSRGRSSLASVTVAGAGGSKRASAAGRTCSLHMLERERDRVWEARVWPILRVLMDLAGGPCSRGGQTRATQEIELKNLHQSYGMVWSHFTLHRWERVWFANEKSRIYIRIYPIFKTRRWVIKHTFIIDLSWGYTCFFYKSRSYLVQL